MPIWYRTGIKWSHAKTVEGASPEVIPPLGVLLFMPLAAIWIVVTLLYSFSSGITTSQQIYLALFGGVAPIAIAYGVMTNRRWTRLVILATLLLNIWLFVASPDVPIVEELDSNRPLTVALLLWVGVAVYFYRWRTARAYYLLLAGKSLPEELQGVDLSPPKALVWVMNHLAILSEWILIVLALGIFFGVLFFSDYL